MWRFFAALFSIQLLAAAATPPPPIVLWSWYAEDDLRFLEDRDVGVAWLALTLNFDRSGLTPNLRRVPIRITPQTWQMIVVRFQFDTYESDRRPAFSTQQRRDAVRMIAETAALTHARAVQLDFDAPQSAYPFYRDLLADLRPRLGRNVFLSITALVSWCQTPHSWLAGLPVDEIVPMAFSMGEATPAIVTMLQRGGQFVFPACRSSIGVEFAGDVRPHKSQRAYFFPNDLRWTPAAIQRARQEILP